jgi:hypothetical protein
MKYLFDMNTSAYERIIPMEDKTMDTKQLAKSILSNGAVWGALFVLVNLIVTTYFPEVPTAIWSAVQVLAVTVLGAVGVSVAAYQVGYVKAAQDYKAQ